LKKKKAKAKKKIKAPFDFESFKANHAEDYARIKKERTSAFEPFKTTPSYQQLLDNSIISYCEKWYREH
jgi:hypothetical protein